MAYVFVDDTDLIKTAKYSRDQFEDVGTQMQWALDLWSGMIKAMGGTLFPEKAFWYAIHFSSTNGEWEYASQEDIEATLKVHDHSGILHKVKWLEPNDVRWTLGMQQCLVGTNNTEAEYLMTVAKTWGDKIHSGKLDWINAWLDLNTWVIK